jgi:outer membrane biosynthesis protein TonB
MTAVLDFIDAAAVVLAGHATYAWNKAGTRIRCNGQECGTVLEAPGGEEEAVLAFARHQAEQLPEPAPLVLPAVTPAEEPIEARTIPAPTVEPVIEPEPSPKPAPELEPDPQPAGEPMATDVAEPVTTPKIRRDTKALQATIAEINKGDRVTAFFKHPRYGEFAVEGTVTKGGAGLDRSQLMVGGWYINLNERAAKYLQELIIVAPAGKHEFDIPKPSEATEHVGIGG